MVLTHGERWLDHKPSNSKHLWLACRELAARLIDKQHHHHELVVSSLHVHLGERHCLEVSVLRGPSGEVRHLGEELLATKGVLHGEIIFTSGERAFNRWR